MHKPLWEFPRTTPLLLVCLALLGSCRPEKATSEPWRPLFNGENLNGWTVKGGTAQYEVRDGQIVGISVEDSPNTFLTTDDNYSDFILELEFRVHPEMNSGIQIRSNSFPSYRNGRVHGYQVEIDPSDRAWSGGIYEEGRRGWLYPLTSNPEASSSFVQNEWNHYRIEAYGDTLKTWINGTPAAYLIDEQSAEGFIGLQVHSIADSAQAGNEIRWRNVRIITDSVGRYTRNSPLPPFNTKNKLLHGQAEAGWQMLWDGETTRGWRGARLDRFPTHGWIIENGELVVLASGGQESAAGGDIVTEEMFGDFELTLDFKLTKGANSGIKYYVDTGLNLGEGSAIGLEYQLLDDKHHPDAKLGSQPGSRTLASVYDLIAANPEKSVNPVGEWNYARIVSIDNKVEHWLNGQKVVEYIRGSPEFRALVSKSKYRIWPNFGEAPSGHLLLQDHGDRVAFKNIKVRPIIEESL